MTECIQQRDEARQQRDAAIAQSANLQQHLNEAQAEIAELQARPQAARLQEREQRVQALTLKIGELRSSLVQAQKDKEDGERGLRSQAETLKRERDELVQQLEAGTHLEGGTRANLEERLKAAKSSVLKSWRLSKRGESKERIELALQCLIREVLGK